MYKIGLKPSWNCLLLLRRVCVREEQKRDQESEEKNLGEESDHPIKDLSPKDSPVKVGNENGEALRKPSQKTKYRK